MDAGLYLLFFWKCVIQVYHMYVSLTYSSAGSVMTVFPPTRVPYMYRTVSCPETLKYGF